jgi:hypothetical protein
MRVSIKSFLSTIFGPFLTFRKWKTLIDHKFGQFRQKKIKIMLKIGQRTPVFRAFGLNI